MVKRPLTLGVAAAGLLFSGSAQAAGSGAAPFPTLKASAGKHVRSQIVERRVRRIETSLIGPGHAAEHAQERAAARRLRRRARREPRAAVLTNDNTLVKPSVGGEWQDPIKLPIVAINSTLMHNGKVLIWAYPWRAHVKDSETGQTYGDPDRAEAYIFDPATGQTREVDPPIDPKTGKATNIFCSGTSLLPDGRVLVVGGNIGDPTVTPNQGLNTVFAFDPDTEEWSRFQPLRQGRWYPTQTLMSDGRTLILAGAPNAQDPDWNYKINADIEIVSPDGTVQTLQNLRANRDDAGNGDGAPLPGQYPHVFWMPQGYAQVAGPRKTDTWRFVAPTAGADNAAWSDTANIPEFRQWAAGVLLPGRTAASASEIMLFGGAPTRDDHDPGPYPNPFPATDTTRVYETSSDTWSAGPKLSTPRTYANSVQLPDNTIAIVGGGTGDDSSKQYYRWQFSEANKRVDLYDPVSDTIRAGNAQAEGRTYHSTAILLPDATVMSAGDDINGPTGPGSGARTDTAEIFKPPYLFKADGPLAPRPALTGVPETIEYGKPFAVTATGDVRRAVLIAPGADTHNTDMAQRVVPLDTPDAVNGGAYNLIAPATADQAPPSFYMLFLLDADGVPSEARFVQLKAPPAPPAPAPTTAPTTDPGSAATPAPSRTPVVTPTPAPKKLGVAVATGTTTLKRVRRRGVLPLRVTVTGAGATVQVSATVKAKRREKVLVTPTATTLNRAGSRRVKATLSPAGVRALATGRRKVVRVTVAAVPLGPGSAVTAGLRVLLR